MHIVSSTEQRVVLQKKVYTISKLSAWLDFLFLNPATFTLHSILARKLQQSQSMTDPLIILFLSVLLFCLTRLLDPIVQALIANTVLCAGARLFLNMGLPFCFLLKSHYTFSHLIFKAFWRVSCLCNICFDIHDLLHSSQ